MKTSIYLCSFSSGLDDMPRKKQRDTVAVLRVLKKCGRFSVFEATANQVIANMMDRLCHGPYIVTDHSCGYPWTKVTLTAAGEALLSADDAMAASASATKHSTGSTGTPRAIDAAIAKEKQA